MYCTTGFSPELLLCDPDNATYSALDFKKGVRETFFSYIVRLYWVCLFDETLVGCLVPLQAWWWHYDVRFGCLRQPLSVVCLVPLHTPAREAWWWHYDVRFGCLSGSLIRLNARPYCSLASGHMQDACVCLPQPPPALCPHPHQPRAAWAWLLCRRRWPCGSASRRATLRT